MSDSPSDQPLEIVIQPVSLDHGTSASLRSELLELAAPYYQDAAPLIDEQLEESTHVELARGADGALLGYFFTRWITPPAGDAWRHLCYGGLAITRYGKGHRAIMRRLLESWDDVGRQRQEDGPIRMWGFTALPFVYDIAASMFEDLAPARDDADALAEHARIAADLRTRFYAPFSRDPWPYALRAISPVRYRREIQQKLMLWGEDTTHALFARHDIDESRGDRLLFHFAP